MLNILKNNIHKIDKSSKKHTKKIKINNSLGYVKHFPCANKEWSNSIYVYNKSWAKCLPVYNTVATHLINNYFNLYDPKTTKKNKKTMSRRRRIKSKRLSINRSFINKANLKHTNSNIVYTSHVYNGQERYLQTSLNSINSKLLKKSLLAKQENIIYMLINDIYLYLQNNKNNKLMSTLSKKNLVTKLEKFYCIIFSKYNYFKRLLVLRQMLKKLKSSIFFEKSKLEKTQLVNNLINKVYSKKVELNFINLKYLYLNSDISAQSISIKLKNRKNNVSNVLRSFLATISLPNTNKFMKNNPFLINKILLLKKINNSNNLTDNYNKDFLNELLQDTFLKNNNVERIFSNIQEKVVNGIRIEASGRLSKRLTAARSVYKVEYKGSLKNINSSNLGLSSIIFRGHVKSNIQYTKETAKTRNGAFGLKIWVSSK